MDSYVGTVLDGRFEISEQIEKGGMGTVYRATDAETGGEVAVKILSRAFLEAQSATADHSLRRFQREARILEALEGCDGVVQFVAARIGGPDWYIAMELVEGRTLRSVFETDGELEPARYLKIAQEMIASLKAIHSHRILHRDLSPDNIVLVRRPDGALGIKFLDFGIGKSLEPEVDPVTKRPTIMGKPQYLSPEQTQGVPLTASSDIYALGVVLYEMLTGQLPIELHSVAELARVRNQDPVPLSAHPGSRRLPEELRALIMACLHKDPAKRPTTDELDECIQELRRRRELGQDISGEFSEWELSPLRDDPDPSESALLSPNIGFGPYQVQWQLGRGPMAEVWTAHDRRRNEEVALKVIHGDEVDAAALLPGLRRAEKLAHENVTRVHAAEVIDGQLCVAMEAVRGETLAAAVEQDGPMPAARILHVGQGLLDALEHAHAADPPLPHGNLTPGNVLLDEFDTVKLCDFGLPFDPARLDPVNPDSHLARYLAPERGLGEPPSVASDIYSLGALLYLMATGKSPFEGAEAAVLFQHHFATPAPPDECRPGLEPAGLSNVILACLAKRREERPASVAALRSELDQAFAARGGPDDPATATTRAGLWSRLGFGRRRRR